MLDDSVDAVCGVITSVSHPPLPLFASNKWLLYVTTNTRHIPHVSNSKEKPPDIQGCVKLHHTDHLLQEIPLGFHGKTHEGKQRRGRDTDNTSDLSMGMLWR